jgi:riboflavin synthase alpha subunit
MPENRIQSPASVSTLVGGIIDDAQQLMRQEVALARREVREELNKAKAAATSLALGAAIAFFGAMMLCFMVVHLITWVSHDWIPLWGSFAIVGGSLTVLGIVLLYAARNRASAIHLLPKQTVETMRENVQWIRNQT